MVKGRKDESQTNGSGKGTFRFRYMDSNRQFEVQADNVSGENLLEGFRHVANAITGRTIAAAPAPAPKLVNKNTAGPTEVLDHKDKDDEGVIEPGPAPAESMEEVTATPTDGAGDRKPRRAAPRAPKFLSDLDLTTAKVSLADFINEKNPDSDGEKYVAIAAWFREQFAIDEVSDDHIFTAYKTLGWQAQMPPDPSQPFRNAKHHKNWFDKGTKRGHYKINWNGQNAVNKMGAAEATK